MRLKFLASWLFCAATLLVATPANSKAPPDNMAGASGISHTQRAEKANFMHIGKRPNESPDTHASWASEDGKDRNRGEGQATREYHDPASEVEADRRRVVSENQGSQYHSSFGGDAANGMAPVASAYMSGPHQVGSAWPGRNSYWTEALARQLSADKSGNVSRAFQLPQLSNAVFSPKSGPAFWNGIPRGALPPGGGAPGGGAKKVFPMGTETHFGATDPDAMPGTIPNRAATRRFFSGIPDPTLAKRHTAGLDAALRTKANNQLTRRGNTPGQNSGQSKSHQNSQKNQAADTLALVERYHAAAAIYFVKDYVKNFTVDGGNGWNSVRNTLFLPMAILILLPGAVLTQVKAIVGSGMPAFALPTAPFEGIQRSIVAIFLIPASYLVINYGIDIANSINYEIRTAYRNIVGGDMFDDAFCGHIRAFPVRHPEENHGIIPDLEPKMFNYFGSTPIARLEGKTLAVKYEDPCKGIYIVPEDRSNDIIPYYVNESRLGWNQANAAMTIAWTILCATQMVFLYYLFFVGPVVAALWVYPSDHLRGAWMQYVDGAISVCLWSLFWCTAIMIMGILHKLDYLYDTGTVFFTACNSLVICSVKAAFDMSSMARELAQKAASVGASVAQAAAAGGKGGGGGGGGKSGGGKSKGGRRRSGPSHGAPHAPTHAHAPGGSQTAPALGTRAASATRIAIAGEEHGAGSGSRDFQRLSVETARTIPGAPGGQPGVPNLSGVHGELKVGDRSYLALDSVGFNRYMTDEAFRRHINGMGGAFLLGHTAAGETKAAFFGGPSYDVANNFEQSAVDAVRGQGLVAGLSPQAAHALFNRSAAPPHAAPGAITAHGTRVGALMTSTNHLAGAVFASTHLRTGDTTRAAAAEHAARQMMTQHHMALIAALGRNPGGAAQLAHRQSAEFARTFGIDRNLAREQYGAYLNAARAGVAADPDRAAGFAKVAHDVDSISIHEAGDLDRTHVRVGAAPPPMSRPSTDAATIDAARNAGRTAYLAGQATATGLMRTAAEVHTGRFSEVTRIAREFAQQFGITASDVARSMPEARNGSVLPLFGTHARAGIDSRGRTMASYMPGTMGGVYLNFHRDVADRAASAGRYQARVATADTIAAQGLGATRPNAAAAVRAKAVDPAVRRLYDEQAGAFIRSLPKPELVTGGRNVPPGTVPATGTSAGTGSRSVLTANSVPGSRPVSTVSNAQGETLGGAILRGIDNKNAKFQTEFGNEASRVGRDAVEQGRIVAGLRSDGQQPREKTTPGGPSVPTTPSTSTPVQPRPSGGPTEQAKSITDETKRRLLGSEAKNLVDALPTPELKPGGRPDAPSGQPPLTRSAALPLQGPQIPGTPEQRPVTGANLPPPSGSVPPPGSFNLAKATNEALSDKFDQFHSKLGDQAAASGRKEVADGRAIEGWQDRTGNAAVPPGQHQPTPIGAAQQFAKLEGGEEARRTVDSRQDVIAPLAGGPPQIPNDDRAKRELLGSQARELADSLPTPELANQPGPDRPAGELTQHARSSAIEPQEQMRQALPIAVPPQSPQAAQGQLQTQDQQSAPQSPSQVMEGRSVENVRNAAAPGGAAPHEEAANLARSTQDALKGKVEEFHTAFGEQSAAIGRETVEAGRAVEGWHDPGITAGEHITSHGVAPSHSSPSQTAGTAAGNDSNRRLLADQADDFAQALPTPEVAADSKIASNQMNSVNAYTKSTAEQEQPLSSSAVSPATQSDTNQSKTLGVGESVLQKTLKLGQKSTARKAELRADDESEATTSDEELAAKDSDVVEQPANSGSIFNRILKGALPVPPTSEQEAAVIPTSNEETPEQVSDAPSDALAHNLTDHLDEFERNLVEGSPQHESKAESVEKQQKSGRDAYQRMIDAIGDEDDQSH